MKKIKKTNTKIVISISPIVILLNELVHEINLKFGKLQSFNLLLFT